MRNVKRLNPLRIARISQSGRHSDGNRLYLNISKSGTKSWVYFYRLDGKQHEIGIGSLLDVGLSRAREKAAEYGELLAAGKDPLEAKREATRVRKARKTFGEVADEYFTAHRSKWSNAVHASQWRSTIDKDCSLLRGRYVETIATADILAVLRPIWKTKPETASRIRARIEGILDAATAQGLRTGDNPARWKGNLKELLPERQKNDRGHHSALTYIEVPGFLTKLREQDTIAAMTLEFCILTAARAGEATGAKWNEIDLSAALWTIPAGRMKSRREHRVPLSSQALAIIEKLAEVKIGEFVFPGRRHGKSNGTKWSRSIAVLALWNTSKAINANTTLHGFTSSFRDFAGDRTSFPREICEAALAHLIGDKAEQAYRRGDALEKRRGLMDAWANFCASDGSGSVVSLRPKAAG